MRRSKLHLVDLAGSERVGKTGVGGQQLTEAKYINLSLHYLEQVKLIQFPVFVSFYNNHFLVHLAFEPLNFDLDMEHDGSQVVTLWQNVCIVPFYSLSYLEISLIVHNEI